MPHIDLFPMDIIEFDAAIAVACVKKSEERFECNLPPDIHPDQFAVPNYFYSRDACLVVSFDGGWYPFLDNTQGYNRPPLRWYIPKVSRLLARIGQEMQTVEQRRYSGGRSGGRVFIHSFGAIRRPASSEVELLRWELPKPSIFLKARCQINLSAP